MHTCHYLSSCLILIIVNLQINIAQLCTDAAYIRQNRLSERKTTKLPEQSSGKIDVGAEQSET